MPKSGVEIKELSRKERKDLESSELVLQFSGSEVHHVLVNTLRRASMLMVPTYAFDPETVNITFNDTIYDNDRMREYISQMALEKIDVPVVYLADKYWRDVDFTDPLREKHPDDKKTIEVHIQKHNDTTDLLAVTTNDVRYVEDLNENPYKFNPKFPSLIIKLRPNQSFRCVAKAALAVGERDDRWSASANCYYDMLGNDKCEFHLHSIGQLDEYDILVRCCLVINRRLEDLKFQIGNELKKSNITTEKIISLELANEDHTMGNLLSRNMKDRNDVIASSYKKPDHHVKEIVLRVESTVPASKVIFSSISNLQKIFSSMKVDFERLAKKHKVDVFHE